MPKLNKTEMYAAEQDSPSLRMTAGVKHSLYCATVPASYQFLKACGCLQYILHSLAILNMKLN